MEAPRFFADIKGKMMATLYHKPMIGATVLLASPVRELEPGFAFALFEAGKDLERAGIKAELAIHAWDCHVDDSRNRLVDLFLQGDCQDLVFIDSDIRFKPRDLIALLSYDRDVVGCSYPMKQDRAEYPVEWLQDRPEIWSDADGLIEVGGLPAGFLRIRRHVLEKLAAKSRIYASKGMDKATTPLIFERTLVGNGRIGGDINFCRKWRKLGGQVYLMPEVGLEHTGKKVWSGSIGFHLRSMVNGAIPTAIDEIRAGTGGSDVYDRLFEAWGNNYAATGDLLSACAMLAREHGGPIMEYGSGLSTLVMAAANEAVHVYAVEHDSEWIEKLQAAARDLRLDDQITILPATVEDGWYTYDKTLAPDRFSVCLVDGPPRRLGGRHPTSIAEAGLYVFDDISDPGVSDTVAKLAKDKGLDFARLNVGHPRAFAVLHKAAEVMAA